MRNEFYVFAKMFKNLLKCGIIILDLFYDATEYRKHVITVIVNLIKTIFTNTSIDSK